MKTCSRCKQDKKYSQFHKNKTKPDGYQHVCKLCKAEFHKLAYPGKREEFLDKNSTRRSNWKAYINKHKQKCAICPEGGIPEVLDFHHLDPDKKRFNIPDITKECFNESHKTRFLDEIAKCVLVCSNCHRKIHLGLLKI
jgi:hypothetical protein